MSPTKADWIELVGIYRVIYRVIVRARTGWRFTSLEWTR